MIAPAAEQSSDIGKTRKLLPFGPKANRFICRDPAFDAKINILAGSVRSAKTWAINLKMLRWLCKYRVAGKRILTGVSKQAIYEHVLCDIFELVGTKNYDYNKQTGELVLGEDVRPIAGLDQLHADLLFPAPQPGHERVHDEVDAPLLDGRERRGLFVLLQHVHGHLVPAANLRHVEPA